MNEKFKLIFFQYPFKIQKNTTKKAIVTLWMLYGRCSHCCPIRQIEEIRWKVCSEDSSELPKTPTQNQGLHRNTKPTLYSRLHLENCCLCAVLSSNCKLYGCIHQHRSPPIKRSINKSRTDALGHAWCTIQTRALSHSEDRGQGCLLRMSTVLTQREGVDTVFTKLELESQKRLLLVTAPNWELDDEGGA